MLRELRTRSGGMLVIMGTWHLVRRGGVGRPESSDETTELQALEKASGVHAFTVEVYPDLAEDCQAFAKGANAIVPRIVLTSLPVLRSRDCGQGRLADARDAVLFLGEPRELRRDAREERQYSNAEWTEWQRRVDIMNATDPGRLARVDVRSLVRAHRSRYYLPALQQYVGRPVSVCAERGHWRRASPCESVTRTFVAPRAPRHLTGN